jgi:vancomycin resistance protein YoaR
MDATVDWAGPDLKFKNDTDYGILIKSWADAATMTVAFYSTPTGRKVEKTVSERSDFTKPTERYILKRGLAPGTKVRTAGGTQGFAVTVHRVVKKDGKVIRRDSFTSNYTPEDIIYRVGPDTPVPAGASIENPPEGLDRGLRN